ncbi:hypothetical protein PVAP13_9KG628300 [Panicum virgatum]|uniref:Uncharacterized protein n=1 Tax=Panicum virgatum TaxID=38727 RepID=A0A8T0NZT1_PANVG|nr:hypothetical protein PVAP13_9KG628300 [Panicum virgatum]
MRPGGLPAARDAHVPLATGVVEALGTSPPDLAPACVDAANAPPPVAPKAAVAASFASTSVVEDDLAPLPATPQPASDDAMNVPPLVAPNVLDLERQEEMIYEERCPAAASQADLTAPAASKISTFIAKVTKPVEEVLQCPPPPKPRKKTLPDDFIPRRSRRVAKLPPISDHKSAESVCRQLCFKNGEEDISDREETISEQALKQYAKIFEQTLSQEHIKALAALFGWNAPTDVEVRSMDNITVM